MPPKHGEAETPHSLRITRLSEQYPFTRAGAQKRIPGGNTKPPKHERGPSDASQRERVPACFVFAPGGPDRCTALPGRWPSWGLVPRVSQSHCTCAAQLRGDSLPPPPWPRRASAQVGVAPGTRHPQAGMASKPSAVLLQVRPWGHEARWNLLVGLRSSLVGRLTHSPS